MQKPSVGRIVHYHARDSGDEDPTPCAAIITEVHGDRVRLCTFDPFTLRFVEYAGVAEERG